MLSSYIIHGHCIAIFVWPTRIIGSAGVYTSLCSYTLVTPSAYPKTNSYS